MRGREIPSGIWGRQVRASKAFLGPPFFEGPPPLPPSFLPPSTKETNDKRRGREEDEVTQDQQSKKQRLRMMRSIHVEWKQEPPSTTRASRPHENFLFFLILIFGMTDHPLLFVYIPTPPPHPGTHTHTHAHTTRPDSVASLRRPYMEAPSSSAQEGSGGGGGGGPSDGMINLCLAYEQRTLEALTKPFILPVTIVSGPLGVGVCVCWFVCGFCGRGGGCCGGERRGEGGLLLCTCDMFGERGWKRGAACMVVCVVGGQLNPVHTYTHTHMCVYMSVCPCVHRRARRRCSRRSSPRR
jgi:hypothetical protein